MTKFLKGELHEKEQTIDFTRQCLPSPDDGSNGLRWSST
ncbi:hypothetical protein ES705_39794 [subsurface metagenome]